jgi:hypothetical protein
MDKIILNDNTSLEFSLISSNGNGLTITFTENTIEGLEPVMTKDNLVKLQVANSNGDVYGIYNNLSCKSITKDLTDNSITVNLKQLDSLEIKVENLQSTVDILVLSSLS